LLFGRVSVNLFPVSFVHEFNGLPLEALREQKTTRANRGGICILVTALEIPPVESPITAVRTVIMAEAKGKK